MRTYDIVIIGSGIAGSMLGLVLSRIGLRCLVVEKGRHPHFVIGESTVPSTSYSLEYLAEMFDIPELRAAYHYTGLKEAGCTGWPKQHFWFGYNSPGVEITPDLEACFYALLPPRGPDIHANRADLDHYLVKQFPKYGVDYVDKTSVTSFEAHDDHAEVDIVGEAGPEKIRCSFVVDCSGHASFLAKKYGLRKEDPGMSTNSRSMFGHFRGVRFLDDVLPENPEVGFLRDGGTMHYCFDGGWIWGIRFDSGVMSVGITLDRDRWPLDESIPAEEEMRAIIGRYPTVHAALGDMTPIRPIIRTGRVHGGTDRIQFSCTSMLGDRFILAPHAAAFIDPLFSTGILLTSAFLVRFAPIAAQAKKDGDWSAERFRPLEQMFFREIEMVDKVVGGMFRAWQHGHATFVHYWRLWLYVGSAMYLTRVGVPQEDPEGVGVFAAGIPSIERLVRRMHGIIFDPGFTTEDGTRRLKACMDEVWSGDRGPNPCEWELVPSGTVCVKFLATGDTRRAQLQLFKWWRGLLRENPSVARKVDFGRVARWFWETRRRRKEAVGTIAQSRAAGGTFHRAYDIMNAIRLGATAPPFTGNPALLWEGAGDAADAWDVHKAENDPVTRAPPRRPPT